MASENDDTRDRSPEAIGPTASQGTTALPAIQLSLPGFEGPLDLLLRLTERQKLDITTVSLVEVTAQYLQHFRAQPWADAVALGDFVAMAARLLLLKSRSLLPRSDPLPEEEEEEESAEELAQALGAYRGYREAASLFGERAAQLGRLFPRAVPIPLTVEPSLTKLPVEQLILVLQQALARFPDPEPEVTLPALTVTVEEKLDEIRARLRRGSSIGFSAIVKRCRSRLEVVVSFIALLHLIRDGEVEAIQSQAFGEITLSLK